MITQVEIEIILDENLKIYQSASMQIGHCLRFYENEIRDLIKLIENLEFEKCEDIFKKLEGIHNKISIIKYKFDFRLNEFLDSFLYDLERIDEAEIRRDWFKKIKVSK